MSHFWTTMGTSASLSWREVGPSPAVLAEIESAFAAFDERYSLYTSESELARVAGGELALTEASEELRETYALAVEWRASTGGAFSPHRPDGRLDLSGVVKALAMRAAAVTLTARGCRDWCLNVGGDILVAGHADEGWTVGIVDPDDRASLLTSVRLAGPRLACATSGSAERGDHIWLVGAARPVFVQVSVMAADIVTADVLATAIVSGGASFLDTATEEWAIDVMSVDTDGVIRMSPGFAGAMRAASSLSV